MGNKFVEERKERLAQLEQFKIVENDFVMIDPSMEHRPSRLNRQIEEGIYNIKPEDYNAEGELKEPVVEEFAKGSFFEHNKEINEQNEPLFERQE